MTEAPALSDLERDAVTELANIGVSRAAASLRKMVGRQVLLSVPSVDILTRKAAAALVSERENDDLVAVQQAFTGPFSGRALLIFPQSNSLELIRAVIGDKDISAHDAAEMEEEALAETGNVILNGCLGTIANMLRQSLHLSLPKVMRGSGVELFEPAVEQGEDGLALFLYINFSVRDRDIRGYIAMLMDLPSLASMRLLVAEFISRYVPAETSMDVDAAASLQELRQLAGPVFASMERSGIPMAVTDSRLPDNRFIFLNAAFTRVFGYELDDLVGASWRTLYGPGSDGMAVAEIEQAMVDARQIELETLSHRKDGTVFQNRVFVSPIPGADGKTAFFLSTHENTATVHRPEVVVETRRKQREEVSERLRATVSLSGGAAAWEWHIRDGRILGDARFAGLYGLNPEDAAEGVSAAKFFSIVHPDDKTRVRLAVDGVLQGADVFSKEYRILLASGAVRWVHARGHCTNDENERPAIFTGVLVDITDQKRVEEQLRIAQSAGGIGTFEHIDGFATATVSTQFCRLLGLQPAASLPLRTINSVVYPEDRPFIGAKGASQAEHMEFRITRPDNGEVRWLARRGEYLHDAEIAGSRFSGVIYDITHSKRTEQQLRDLNETLETRVREQTQERDGIWQLSRDLLGIADRQGVWLNINPAWTHALGWNEDEIVGRNSQWLEHPDDAGSVASQIDDIVRSGTIKSFRSRLRTRSGQYRWLAWTAVPQEGFLYCIARDITEQLDREENLARAEEQLRQSQKMEAIGQLTGGIAHDFNNMLTGITASLDLIRRRFKAGRTDDVVRFIDAATSSAERAATLTHSLLAFSRRQSLDIAPKDVNALVGSLMDMLQRAVGESISLKTVLAPDLWPAFTDANQLENALLNLAINARDAMPDGGTLAIETSNTKIDQTYALINEDAVAGDYVMVSVTDTGVGMAPDVLAKAFDPFFTTKPIGQGTGLGLSMIYGFVKQSGGHVRIESAAGKGTTIRMYLPRAQRDESIDKEQPKAAAPQGRGEMVLLVEDDETVRLLVTQVLKELGYRYIEAADARAAIPHLQSNQQIDLLVTDVGLPRTSGRQLADIARQLRPDLRVLFITGYAEKAALRNGFLGPGMELMTKPFALDALGEKIRQLIEG
jgi:PAS domain S-box-containing protein